MSGTETEEPTDVRTTRPDEPAEAPATEGRRGESQGGEEKPESQGGEEKPDSRGGEEKPESQGGEEKPDSRGGEGEPDRDAAPVETTAAAPLVVTMVPAGEPWRWWNRATPVLLVIALPVVGFLAGVLTQQQWGGQPAARTSVESSTTTGPASTTGTLKTITGDAMTVETATGTTVTVKIAEATKIRKPTTLAGLTVGQPITVEGSAEPDGTVTATTVTAS